MGGSLGLLKRGFAIGFAPSSWDAAWARFGKKLETEAPALEVAIISVTRAAQGDFPQETFGSHRVSSETPLAQRHQKC